MNTIDEYLQRTLAEDQKFLQERIAELDRIKSLYPDQIDTPEVAGLQEIIDDLKKNIFTTEKLLKQRQKTEG